MSITAYIEDDKKFYEVFVKGRDSKGRQVAQRKRGITSDRKAKDFEFEFKKELEVLAGTETPWTWGDWHAECLKRMKLTYKEGTMMGYEGGLKKWMPSDWAKKELPTKEPEPAAPWDPSVHDVLRREFWAFGSLGVPCACSWGWCRSRSSRR